MENTKNERSFDEFELAARPLMEYLAKNHHPHTAVIVESDSAELVEGKKAYRTKEFIVD